MLGPREKRRLVQLGVCLLLFLAVFLAKGTDRFERFREELSRMLYTDTDFKAAFSDLGRSLAEGKLLSSLNWQDAAPAAETLQPTETAAPSPSLSPMPAAALAVPQPTAAPTSMPTPEPTPEPTPVPAVIYMEYTGPALPDNTTMDRYELGLGETAAPVEGRVTSGFGWREHPIEGEERFHYGVDLKADEGTTVRAFADGEVEYIGESDIYGQYLQLRHDNAVTTFYAHCSELCVQQGERVTVGEKVAASGATGAVTGPHLHFEMKKDGVRLNPVYYIDNK